MNYSVTIPLVQNLQLTSRQLEVLHRWNGHPVYLISELCPYLYNFSIAVKL